MGHAGGWSVAGLDLVLAGGLWSCGAVVCAMSLLEANLTSKSLKRFQLGGFQRREGQARPGNGGSRVPRGSTWWRDGPEADSWARG